MYKRANRDQLYLEGFTMQFGGKMKADNRWVKLSALMPWQTIEDIYARNFTEKTGTGAINSRIAFGAIYIKKLQNLTDRETVDYIAENPYVQYFLGLSDFKEEALFDPSMMVHFRKRFPPEAIEKINELLRN